MPQNLRLFVEIVGPNGERLSSEARNISSVVELHAHYVEVMVRRDELLGEHACAQLGILARRMMNSRTLHAPRGSLTLSDAQLQRLTSHGLLAEPSPGMLQFGHQTLLDAVIVGEMVSEWSRGPMTRRSRCGTQRPARACARLRITRLLGKSWR